MTKRDYSTFEAIGLPTVWYTCPHCGYDKVPFPTRPEAWRQYEADGVISLRQDVVEVQHIHAIAERDAYMPVAFLLGGSVIALPFVELGTFPVNAFVMCFSIGTLASLMFAVRYRQSIAEPVDPEPDVELPETTEVIERNRQTLFRFSRDDVKYPSGDKVPDLYLWKIARAYETGTPFSRQMYTGSSKVVTRPAFEALRDAMVKAGVAYHNGQDIELMSRGRNVLAQWAELKQPTPPL